MKYQVEFTDIALADLQSLKRSEPKSYSKALALIQELYGHPTYGTGHPEQLKGDRAGQWSRRITQKHRLVYMIKDNKLTVLVLTAAGHYDK